MLDLYRSIDYVILQVTSSKLILFIKNNSFVIIKNSKKVEFYGFSVLFFYPLILQVRSEPYC